jgi:hypothetical protein
MEDDEEDVSNYWIALMKAEDSGTLKGSSRWNFVENWLWQCMDRSYGKLRN